MEIESAPTITSHNENNSQHVGSPEEHDMLGEEENREEEEEEQYQLTELKNMTAKSEHGMRLESPLEELTEDDVSSSSVGRTHSSSDEFLIQLADAVSRHPCLYNPEDEYYGSKHSSAEHRAQIWRKIAKECRWQDDIHALQAAWKRLRDRFVRRLRKNGASDENLRERHPSDCDNPLYESMRWLAPFISTASERNSSQSGQSSQSNEREYYVDNQMEHDVMISGYQSQHPSSQSTPIPPHRIMAQNSGTPASHHEMRSGSNNSTGYYIVRNPPGSQQSIRVVTNNSDGQKVTVVPATRTINGNAVLHLQPGQQVPRNHQRVHIIQAPVTNNHGSFERILSPADPGVTVTASGSAGMIGSVKKDQPGMSMVIDPTPYFHNGHQKMYRLVNVADVNEAQSGLSGGPPRKRMVLHRSTQLQHQSPHNQQNNMSGSGSNNRLQGGQMADEVIIEDGIAERTVVIDEDDPDSPMLSESPGLGSMMISGHQVLNSRNQSMGQRGLSQQHHQISEPPLSTSPSPHPGYLQQSQYDADLQFQQMISQSLSRYDDDTKAMMKFNIQRLLLEARYGPGACTRMMQDEELSESAAPSVVAHEMVQ